MTNNCLKGRTEKKNDENHSIIDDKDQKVHHKKVSFEEEYRNFQKDNGVDIDEGDVLKE